MSPTCDCFTCRLEREAQRQNRRIEQLERELLATQRERDDLRKILTDYYAGLHPRDVDCSRSHDYGTWTVCRRCLKLKGVSI